MDSPERKFIEQLPGERNLGPIIETPTEHTLRIFNMLSEELEKNTKEQKTKKVS